MGRNYLKSKAVTATASMPCSPLPATTSVSSRAGSNGFLCALADTEVTGSNFSVSAPNRAARDEIHRPSRFRIGYAGHSITRCKSVTNNANGESGRSAARRPSARAPSHPFSIELVLVCSVQDVPIVTFRLSPCVLKNFEAGWIKSQGLLSGCLPEWWKLPYSLPHRLQRRR
jgi:hypothetical protein